MRVAAIIVLCSTTAFAESTLQQQIRSLAAAAQGTVSVACSLPGSNLNCDLSPHARPPMQSVFKLPLAVVALHQVERGALTLDQPVRFLPSDRILPKPYSHLQDRYPEAGIDIPLRELLRLAVSLSDNTAADVVLRVIGGPAVVDAYLESIGVAGFQLQDNEQALHRDEQLQYRNWFEPGAAVQLLRLLSDHALLSAENTRILLEWMASSPTGAHRIKGDLPAGTVVMHKTGSSDTVSGITAATNDIGLITLPDGRRLAIAIFVSDSAAGDARRDEVIAHIAAAAYGAALHSMTH
jgi:beta-lactamase class A